MTAPVKKVKKAVKKVANTAPKKLISKSREVQSKRAVKSKKSRLVKKSVTKGKKSAVSKKSPIVKKGSIKKGPAKKVISKSSKNVKK